MGSIDKVQCKQSQCITLEGCWNDFGITAMEKGSFKDCNCERPEDEDRDRWLAANDLDDS